MWAMRAVDSQTTNQPKILCGQDALPERGVAACASAPEAANARAIKAAERT
jgi:hypothetical protein